MDNVNEKEVVRKDLNINHFMSKNLGNDATSKAMGYTEDDQTRTEEVQETSWSWMVLAGCFVCRMLTDGTVPSFGVFIVAWQEQFPGSLTQLTWIASLIAGLQCITGPIGSALCKTYSIRQVVLAGAILTSLSFIAASLATSLWHFYVTSALAGLGLGLCYQPSFVILTYYFDKRLARANGFVSAGASVGMLATPPLLQVIINTYGSQGALLILTALVSHMGVCAALFRPTVLELKNRGSVLKPSDTSETEGYSWDTDVPSKTSNHKPFISTILEACDITLLKKFYFLLMLMSYFLYGLAYIISYHYISSRAVHTGTSELNAAYLISAIGVGSLVTRMSHGYIIDCHIMTAAVLTAISFLVSGIACALIPVSDKYSNLFTLAIFVGLSSGVYHSTITVIAKDYVGIQQVSGGIGWILLSIGAGIILGSYLTGVLVDATGNYSFPFYLAAACFLISTLLTSALPLIKYLRNHCMLNEKKSMRTLKDGSNGNVATGRKTTGTLAFEVNWAMEYEGRVTGTLEGEVNLVVETEEKTTQASEEEAKRGRGTEGETTEVLDMFEDKVSLGVEAGKEITEILQGEVNWVVETEEKTTDVLEDETSTAV